MLILNSALLRLILVPLLCSVIHGILSFPVVGLKVLDETTAVSCESLSEMCINDLHITVYVFEQRLSLLRFDCFLYMVAFRKGTLVCLRRKQLTRLTIHNVSQQTFPFNVDMSIALILSAVDDLGMIDQQA